MSGVSLWSNISAKRAAKIRATVVEEVREELTAKLTPKIRQQVKDELWDKARKEAQQTAEQDLLKKAPSERERSGFIELVKETELDAHAQATTASGSGDKWSSKAQWSRRLWGPWPWVLILGALPALYGVFRTVGSCLSVEFIGAAVGLLVALGVSWVLTWRHQQYDEEAKRLYKIASDYLVLAERARAFRLVHAERMWSKARLDDLTEQLRKSKVELDNKYHPRIEEVDQARESVRHRIAIESVDIEEDFDERLAESKQRVVVGK